MLTALAGRISSIGRAGSPIQHAAPARQVPLPSEMGKITTVLFDLDGTLLDTESLVNGVASQIVSGYGKTLTHKIQQQALGKRPSEAWEIVADELEIPKTGVELFDESEPLLVDRWQHCNLLPGARRLVDHFAKHGIKLGVVTSTPTATFDKKMCCKQELASNFPVIVTGDTVRVGKPDPEGYLEAARQLDSKPEDCLVFEDAPAGFQAGLAAGMKVVAVPSLPGLTPETFEGCTKLASLLDFDPEAFGLPPFQDTIEGVVPLQPEWTIKGPVIKGFGRGSSELGIPTANLPPEALMDRLSGAVSGIYCGFASIGGKKEVYKMVMSLGWNPFYNNEERTAEPWILHDFKEEFYGEELRLVVCGYIRPEANFTTLEALIARIHEDANVTRLALERPELSKSAESAFLLPSSAAAS